MPIEIPLARHKRVLYQPFLAEMMFAIVALIIVVLLALVPPYQSAMSAGAPVVLSGP